MGIEDADNTNSQSFDYLGKVGFKYCRVLVHFENTVKADGTYNWNDTDSFIDGTLAAGMIPVVTIGTGLGVFGSYSDALAAMPGYLSALVQRYAGKGIVWEAFNEPYYVFLGDTSHSDKVISDWVAMSKLLGQYVVKYDPAATYLTGGFTANADYKTENDDYVLWGQTMRKAFQQGLLDYASAVSYHPYQINTAPESLLATTGFNQAAHRVDNLIQQYSRGRVKSVITEFGYSTSNQGLITLTEQQQAQWLARSMFVFDLLDVPIIILFRDVGHKVGTTEETGVTSTAKHEYGFGLFNSDSGTDPYRGFRITGDRPSGALVRSLLGKLKDYVLQGRLSTVSAGDFCLIYQLGNSKKMVYWTTGDSHSVVIDGQIINLTATPQVMAWAETDIEFAKHTSEMPGSRWVGQKTIQLTADGNHIASGILVLTFIDLADTILVDVTSYLSSLDPKRAGTFTDIKLPLPDANSSAPFAIVGAVNQTIIRYGMILADGIIGSWIGAPATYDAGTDFSIHFSYTSRDALTSIKNYL